jgi:Trypsin-co-occurring domain 1
MAGSRLIPVRVGGVEIEAEAVLVAGTEPTSGRLSKAAEGVTDAFTRAQEAIVGVARSTAELIERAGDTARPDRVEVEFGLKFSASGGVIMAGVAGEATLKVTLSYDVAANTAANSAPANGAANGTPSGTASAPANSAPANSAPANSATANSATANSATASGTASAPAAGAAAAEASPAAGGAPATGAGPS